MTRLSDREAMLLFRRVGTGLEAGVDILRIWELEAGQGPPLRRRYMSQIRERIGSGQSLATAMKDCGDYFSKMAIQLVNVGEMTGHTEVVFLRLADHYQHTINVRRGFLAGIAWPALQLVAAIGIVGLLILIMGMLPTQVDILGFGLVGTRGLVIYLFIIAAVAGVVFLVIQGLRRGWYGQAPLVMAMHIPVLGKALQTINLSTLSWSLALALQSGLDARRSIRMAVNSTQNLFYTAHLEGIDKSILDGEEFHVALRKTNVYPDEFVDTLQASELSGTQAESMMRLSDEYRQRAQTYLKMLAMFAGGVIWAGVLVLIIIMVFRIFFVAYLGPINEALEMMP
ncbi:MAG: type II secretion system F family protein [Pirellulaceae bacterium]|jgi:type IV pilus assembly protein PilC|nr:type II secretion system F family protein [Pirellulaceae bacterium]MDP7014642.1 type II secretion system F family protein [Pirellulaceae bacterium]